MSEKKKRKRPIVDPNAPSARLIVLSPTYVTASHSPQHCGAVRAADRDLFSNGQDAHISLLLVDEVGTSIPNSP